MDRTTGTVRKRKRENRIATEELLIISRGCIYLINSLDKIILENRNHY